MPDTPPSKKLWDRAAWRDAGFFLRYLRPHFNVFIPALIALAFTGGLTVVFIKELAALAGKGLGGASGPEWMAELDDKALFLVGLVATQAFVATQPPAAQSILAALLLGRPPADPLSIARDSLNSIRRRDLEARREAVTARLRARTSPGSPGPRQPSPASWRIWFLTYCWCRAVPPTVRASAGQRMPMANWLRALGALAFAWPSLARTRNAPSGPKSPRWRQTPLT